MKIIQRSRFGKYRLNCVFTGAAWQVLSISYPTKHIHECLYQKLKKEFCKDFWRE